ncbi:helix-turn-helix domain-containing protein [Paenibacillus paeoniae]|uniref:Helix-turn-helix domain-containing protein n=1 Tax=Paenibacillus paeoniae TaxID=2292705 RepID=A0A371PNY1_9BACL|nr:helix-turn-helix domain-containing protein [Paenibacillus paeoniae]
MTEFGGLDSKAGNGIVEFYVHYFRKKLSSWHTDQYIQTVRGLGCILVIIE